MPLIIVRNDITTMRVDAIVNAANESLLGGGGVDGCIHRAAGPELLAECRRLGGCRTGEAKLTRGYRLPCKYIIHTVGPVWHGGDHGEQEQLVSCYRTSLALARKHHCQTVAFPLISSGVYGYPKEQALRTAMDAIGAFLLEHDMTVYLVIFDRSAYQISSRLFADIAAYIDDHYVDAHTDFIRSRPCPASIPVETQMAPSPAFSPASRPPRSLDDRLKHLDAGFSETLLTRIDRSGKKDSEIYKRANVDRKLFSKIRSNPDYRPSKPTALAFAIALELDLTETRDLIARAGYALSRSSKFDVIIEYFISQRNYNIYEINEALFAFDQSLLGA
ncbi:MAG: O-acetyl-ADP-ribose deacetylase [Oscillospiraceae bacterium]